MPRVALGVAYNGEPWQGWQTQPSGLTVQDTLESVLSRFLNKPTSTICAGRTDTGVHALQQVVHLDTDAQRDAESWVRGLNAMLPSSVAVQWACEVSSDFHARFSAVSRTYVYLVRHARVRSPLTHGRAGWVYRPLYLEPMREAASRLVGKHDFSAFRSSQCQAASPVRTLQSLEVIQQDDCFAFVFKANAFLHHMVRNLMGALLYIGQGKHEPGWIETLLAQRDRRLSAPTFASAGLYLAGVEYPSRFELPTADLNQLMATHFLPACIGTSQR